jgi:hypothetical protein
MKNQTQQIAMYMALGAAITMLVLYFSGQLKFVEYLEGEGRKVRRVSRSMRVRRMRMVSRLTSPIPIPIPRMRSKYTIRGLNQ